MLAKLEPIFYHPLQSIYFLANVEQIARLSMSSFIKLNSSTKHILQQLYCQVLFFSCFPG